jgi:hypothetical protein
MVLAVISSPDCLLEGNPTGGRRDEVRKSNTAWLARRGRRHFGDDYARIRLTTEATECCHADDGRYWLERFRRRLKFMIRLTVSMISTAKSDRRTAPCPPSFRVKRCLPVRQISSNSWLTLQAIAMPTRKNRLRENSNFASLLKLIWAVQSSREK